MKHASLVRLTPDMSRKHREQAVVRAYANQDAIDMISDDDWDEYEARLLEGSSSGTMATPPKHETQSSSKSSPQKRKRDDTGTSTPTDSDERATKRPRGSDECKSGKPFKTKTEMVGARARTRTDPVDIAAPPKDIIDVDADADDSNHSTRTHSVVNRVPVGPPGRGRRACAIITPMEIHASAAAALSRLSGSGSSSTKRLSKLGASGGDSKTLLPLSAPTPPLPPKPSARASAPVVEKKTDDVGGRVTPSVAATAAAKTKGKPAAGASKVKLVRPEKKKTKKELEAEKKALDLREKKMTRREFIQYLYEEKLKEELENAPLKTLVLKDKVIWYAEPGNAKASDSFDRRRYEMVCPCVPRSVSVWLFARPCLSCSPARSPWSHRRAGFRPHNSYPCHIPDLHEERRTEVGTNGIRQAFADPGKCQDRVVELGVSKHRIEADCARTAI